MTGPPIKSTTWPELIMPLPTSNPAAHVWLTPGELAQASRLLDQLEVSLQGSQRVLLAGDIAVLENYTAEQNGLIEALLHLMVPRLAAQPLRTHNLSPGKSLHATSLPGAVLLQIHAAQARVLHLARVQASLLLRAQRHFTMLLHLKTRFTSTYAPAQSQAAGASIHG